jgi:hypothetical protein
MERVIENKIQAQMIEDILIISDLGAETSGVWRIHMPKTATVFFEVITDKKNYNLLMREGKTKKQIITIFKNKEAANQALHAVTMALMGTSKGAQAKTEKADIKLDEGRSFGQKAVLVVFFFLVIGLFLFSQAIQDNAGQNGLQRTISKPSSQMRVGVPIPAEQLFGN